MRRGDDLCFLHVGRRKLVYISSPFLLAFPPISSSQHFFRQTRRDTRTAPGTLCDADAAAVILDKIGNALVEIDIPFARATHGLLFGEYRVDRTGSRANLTERAEVVGAEDIRRVVDERHIRHNTR